MSDLLIAIASITVAFYFSFRLTFVLLTTIPISFIILHFVASPLAPAIQAQKQHLAEASKLASASITAIDLVKIFNAFDTETWHYLKAIQRAAAQYLIQARCNTLQIGYGQFLSISLFFAGFWYGAALVDSGASPGSILTTFYATLLAFEGFESLMPQWLVLSKGMAAGLELRELTRNDEVMGSDKEGHFISWPSSCVGHVTLENVSTFYSEPLPATWTFLKRR